jgi:hypothetical protein
MFIFKPEDADSDEHDKEQYNAEPERYVCPHCNGTALSPYDDGGSCPHCFGGYLPFAP